MAPPRLSHYLFRSACEALSASKFAPSALVPRGSSPHAVRSNDHHQMPDDILLARSKPPACVCWLHKRDAAQLARPVPRLQRAQPFRLVGAAENCFDQTAFVAAVQSGDQSLVLPGKAPAAHNELRTPSKTSPLRDRERQHQRPAEPVWKSGERLLWLSLALLAQAGSPSAQPQWPQGQPYAQWFFWLLWWPDARPLVWCKAAHLWPALAP
mmetsp:Transcript_29671/g.58774  ORF Transcript_29671/g.58774 Transcript_29671/m.58774 type:complete len:211 (+) Transcript_29671:2186-2818(+)